MSGLFNDNGLVLHNILKQLQGLGTGNQSIIPINSSEDEIFTADNPAVVEVQDLDKYDGGIATGGSKTTIVDTTKDFVTNMFTGNIAKVNISGKEYYRTVASNTATTLTIATLPGASATAKIGETGTSEVTITVVAEGIEGNEYSVEVVEAPGTNDNLSASLTGDVLTVYLGKTSDSLDNTKNTGTLVASAIDALPEFTAVLTGSGGVVPVTVNPVEFSGGIATVRPTVGTLYQIMRKNIISDGGNSITVDGSVNIAASTLVEQLTQADAETGVITFAENISTIKIHNTDAVNAGVFTVNGIDITVPVSTIVKETIGGIPSKDVTITGATTYIVSRYE